jgi:hypothetical protein
LTTHRPPKEANRLGPRISLDRDQVDLSFTRKLEYYYLTIDSSPDFFNRKIPASMLRELNLERWAEKGLYLSNLHWSHQYVIIMRQLYNSSNYSLHFRRKLTKMLQRGRISTVRQWFHTANGVVLPLLIEEEGINQPLQEIDILTKFVLENCANNYALILASLKKTKKILRKNFGLRPLKAQELSLSKLDRGDPKQRICGSYASIFYRWLRKKSSLEDRARTCVLWTQTRATGLADGSMIRSSYEKFLKTISEPGPQVQVEGAVIDSILKPSRLTGKPAHISCGPKACLENTQQEGGQTAYLAELARTRVVPGVYNLSTLELERFERPQRVSDARSLLDWAIGFCLGDTPQTSPLPSRIIARCVRTHCVVEPSKARMITVACYAYQVIMGVLARALTACLYNRQSISGLTKDRHLWNFFYRNLAQDSLAWDQLHQGELKSFSTDLEEATDHLNWSWCREVFNGFARALEKVPNAQIQGLLFLGKHLYCNSRYVFYPELDRKQAFYGKSGQRINVPWQTRKTLYGFKATRRAAFMGDMFTKVILTVTTDYLVAMTLLPRSRVAEPLFTLEEGEPEKISRAKAYLNAIGRVDPSKPREGESSNVGDDVVVIDNRHNPTEEKFLAEASILDVRISMDDTFSSIWISFYCEEMSIVPQNPWDTPGSTIRAGGVLGYIDYPRIRLLLRTFLETDPFSSTDSGRFSLLGKETRWVYETLVKDVMHKNASLLQHLLLLRDKECLCPYLPKEIGGDGSFTNDPEFLLEVIQRKAHDPHEAMFRITQLCDGTWARKYASRENTTEGILKHDVLIPSLLELRNYLPEGTAITPANQLEKDILASCAGIRKGLFETPTETFFKVLRRYYYKYLLSGRGIPPEIPLTSEVVAKRGKTLFPDRDYVITKITRFIKQWKNPGFMFRDEEPYYVIPDQHPDYLSVGWFWGNERPREDHDISGLSVHELVEAIITGNPLVTQRLHLFFESDSFIKGRVAREKLHGKIVLISRDVRLAVEVLRISQRHGDSEVFMIDPVYHMSGKVGFVLGDRTWDHYLTDEGSISFLTNRINSIIRQPSYYRRKLRPHLMRRVPNTPEGVDFVNDILRGLDSLLQDETSGFDSVPNPFLEIVIPSMLDELLENCTSSTWTERSDRGVTRIHPRRDVLAS